MSTIKVQNIQHTGSSTNAIALASDGTCAANITSLNGGQFSNRNVIINGACQIAQRSNLATAQAGYGAVDRFSVVSGGASRFTLSKNAGPGAQYGLPSALKFETTTADNSVAATDYMYLDTRLEGQDMQRFQKGSSDAKQYTLQFWIKLAITGTYVVQLFDTDNSRHVVANYTVSSTNWEKKIITFPADTSGALNNDNAKSFEVRWHFMGGSNYRSGTQQTTWGSIVAGNMLAGMGNAVSATGDNFLTGVQLEVGSVATDFEHRSFGQELALCQRYFYNHVTYVSVEQAIANMQAYSSSAAYGNIDFPVTMRTNPSIDATSGGNYYIVYGNATSTYSNSISLERVNVNGCEVNTTGSYTQGYAYFARTRSGAKVSFSAEL